MTGNSGHGTQAAPAASSEIPTRNERGIIAESYYDLQGLAVLKNARARYALPTASPESTLRAVFQSVDIVLLNLANILQRAAGDLDRGVLNDTSVKMLWARGFHRLLARLSLIPHQLGFLIDHQNKHGVLRIADSPAFCEYLEALKTFDRAALRLERVGVLRPGHVVANESLESAQFNLIHSARISNHESTIWERNLAHTTVPAAVPSYEQFVVSDVMREAVYERVLTGDTYFTQFRGLHQVPEILGEEINDRLEQAIRDVRAERLREAVDQLRCVDVLSDGILASLPPMIDNLATSDYHQIRENLGLTSGSHSVCLRFDMFTNLYEQLWDELKKQIEPSGHEEHTDSVENALVGVQNRRFNDWRSWTQHILTNYCSKFQAFIFHWRDEHLNLPRNNLGGEFTKSLTGSPDAVQAVKHMRDAARLRDPMQPLLRAQGLVADGSAVGALTRYLESDASWDTHILSVTGKTTQERFHDVQERLGYFANKCPFTPPARREA